jgi:hypothetical protein
MPLAKINLPGAAVRSVEPAICKTAEADAEHGNLHQPLIIPTR